MILKLIYNAKKQSKKAIVSEEVNPGLQSPISGMLINEL